MRIFSGILLVLLFPVLLIGAIYLWRKRAAAAKAQAAPQVPSGNSNAAQQITQTAQQITQVANAGAGLIKAFSGLIPSNDDYTPDSSEMTSPVSSIRYGESGGGGINIQPIIA